MIFLQIYVCMILTDVFCCNYGCKLLIYANKNLWQSEFLLAELSTLHFPVLIYVMGVSLLTERALLKE